jgi:hypothetical protein
MIVRGAWEDYLIAAKEQDDEEWNKRHEGREPRLFISSLGHCPRAAFHDAVSYLPDHPFYAAETHPFSTFVLDRMREGTEDEAKTEKALRYVFGDQLKTQVEVGDHIWAGRIDFFVEPDMVIEHKATAAYNFKRKDGLPYDFHCLQVLAYQLFLQEQLKRSVYPRLYYRSFGNWAEFHVFNAGTHILWEGHVNGRERQGAFDIDLIQEFGSFEHYWERDELPPKYDHPLEKRFGCARSTKQGVYPDCRYFGHCWPELPQDGPFDEETLGACLP